MEKLLRSIEAARLLRVSRGTLERWKRRGLPYSKIEGTCLFSAAELVRWVKEHRAQ